MKRTKNRFKFKREDRVEKFTGSYHVHGTIRTGYTTTRGDVRYVVEIEPQGFQMIYAEEQLRALSREKPEHTAALQAEEEP